MWGGSRILTSGCWALNSETGRDKHPDGTEKMGGTHIANQPLRSGTAGAPNYAEARAAESAVDFIHKLGIVLKELNESRVWLQLILKRQHVAPKEVQPVLEECVALSRIIGASRRTAAENAGKLRNAKPNYPLSMDNG